MAATFPRHLLSGPPYPRLCHLPSRAVRARRAAGRRPGPREPVRSRTVTRCAELPFCSTFSRGPCGAARHTGICWGRGPGGQLGVPFQGQSLCSEASRPQAVYLIRCPQAGTLAPFQERRKARREPPARALPPIFPGPSVQVTTKQPSVFPQVTTHSQSPASNEHLLPASRGPSVV